MCTFAYKYEYIKIISSHLPSSVGRHMPGTEASSAHGRGQTDERRGGAGGAPGEAGARLRLRLRLPQQGPRGAGRLRDRGDQGLHSWVVIMESYFSLSLIRRKAMAEFLIHISLAAYVYTNIFFFLSFHKDTR